MAVDFERVETLARVRWQLRLRWLALGFVVLALAAAASLLPGALPLPLLLVLVAFLASANLVIVLLLVPRLGRPGGCLDPELLIKVQIGLDLVVCTAFLHWSGGSENPAAIFFVLQVIIAGVLLAGSWAYACAAASSILYALVLGLEYTGAIAHVHLAGITDPTLYRRPALLLLLWGVLTGALFAAAYLVTSIVEKLQQRERQLFQSSSACELRSGELAEANRRLSEMANARATFLRYFTHELRAPVAAIQSYLRLMREGYIERERLPEIAARAERRSGELLQLIGDLLDLGQVEQAQAREGRVRLNLADAVGDAVDMLRPSAVEKHISLLVEIADDIPIVFGNPRQLALLWSNLVGNAIKYTPDGGRVHVDLHRDNEIICLDIADTGIGIPPQDRERVFQEFYRTESARRFAPHGTGIGLAIAKRVVDLHEGTISIDSEAGQGSIFHVRLPLSSLRAKGPLAPPPHLEEWPDLPQTLV